ncbi:MAG: hypothetical protein K9I29_06535 [Bacteroidales bacterium]|nr:hypothetical protein [Bacteroidales bacterium]MCF8327936.1 hypothetical protein [Bacteroidales bacterium]
MTRSDYKDKLNEILNSNFQLDLREILMKATEYFKAEPLLFIVYTFFIMMFNVLTLKIQPIGYLINISLMPVLISGFFYAARQMDNGKKITINDFFRGFRSWQNIFIAATFSGLLILLGLFMLVIPGIYLAVAYVFVIPFIVYADFEYWDAMEASRKLVSKNLPNILGLIAVLILINLLGLMLLGIGTLFTLPITYLSVHVAFNKIFAEAKSETTKNDPRKIDLRHFR